MKLACPYCGTVNTFDDSLYGQDIMCGVCGKVFVGRSATMSTSVRKPATMSTSVRKGVTDAKVNEEMAGYLFLEILILSIAAGFETSSWWVFGGVFLGLLTVINIPQLVEFICWIAAIAWGVIGFGIGMSLIEDTGAAVVLFIILGLVSYGVHKAAIQYFNDVGTS